MCVGVGEGRQRRIQLIDADRHVLELWKLVEVACRTPFEVQFQMARFVEDEYVRVTQAERIAAPADFRRTEQIKEVGVVESHGRHPVVSAIRGSQVKSLG